MAIVAVIESGYISDKAARPVRTGDVRSVKAGLIHLSAGRIR